MRKQIHQNIFAWVLAILAPFAMQLAIELPTGFGAAILVIKPHALSLFLYYGIIATPSYILLARFPNASGRTARLITLTGLLVLIIPAAMATSIYVGCYLFGACP
jgi:hypothetical protein